MKKTVLISIVTSFTALMAFGIGEKERRVEEYPVRDITETIEAPAAGTVIIDVPMGSVTAEGWDKNEIQVNGTIGRHLVDFEITTTQDEIILEAVLPDINNFANLDLDANLEIWIPRQSSLKVYGMGADVILREIYGPKECESFMGSITVEGKSGPISAQTISGNITVTGPADRVMFRSSMGKVLLQGIQSEIMGNTMNGEIRIEDSLLSDLDLSTMTGNIFIACALQHNAHVKATSQLGGRISLTVPPNVEGRFTVRSNPGPGAVDLSGFKPQNDIDWVFDGSLSTAKDASAGRIGPDSARSSRTTIGSGARVALPETGDRVLALSDALYEFTVGNGDARVYIDSSSLANRRGDDAAKSTPRIVLSTN